MTQQFRLLRGAQPVRGRAFHVSSQLDIIEAFSPEYFALLLQSAKICIDADTKVGNKVHGAN